MLATVLALVRLALATELTALPGSEVRLPVEPGFTVAERWVGVGNPATNASVAVTRVDAPVGQLVAGFTDEGLAQQGVTVRARRPTHLDRYDGVWLEGAQGPATVVIAVVGDDTRAWLLKGVSFTPADGRAVTRMLKGAVWGEAAPADLAFSLETPAGLRLAAEMAGARIYTVDGQMGSATGQPLFVVAPSVRAVAPGVDTARALFAGITGLTDTTVDAAMPVLHAGQAGWDLRGRGTDTTTGGEMVAWQRVLFAEEGTYLRLVGVAPLVDADRWVAAWEAAAGTLRME